MWRFWMSSVTTIINAISYVLIAFVAISLVVSSIMIGIITYISVLERTKEIGILRAIGASKRDISRVFNAETLIEGFCSGAIGIGITLLLIIPINLVVHHLTGYREPERHCWWRAARRSWSSACFSRLSRPYPLRHRRAQGPCRSAAHRITRYLTFKKDVFRRKTSFFSFTAILQKATF